MAQRGSNDQCDMGNINKIAIKPGRLKEIHQKIRILNFKTLIDNIPTSIDEGSSTVLKYKTPNFSPIRNPACNTRKRGLAVYRNRYSKDHYGEDQNSPQTQVVFVHRASATVEIAPIPENHKYKVGWIQACTDMMFHNTYAEDGYTSWEFPELTSGAQNMISDCDGHHYPWYGSRNETVTFEGPCKMYQTATVTMNDNFHPHVTWRNPSTRNQGPANLTRIARDQSFYVWLVVWDMTLQKAYILKTIMWNMQLQIDVDPNKPLGQRAKLVSNPVPKQPQVLDENVPIPRCALMPPNANSAQMLVWRPRLGKPLCIIPPVWKKDVPIEKQVTRYDSKLCRL